MRTLTKSPADSKPRPLEWLRGYGTDDPDVALRRANAHRYFEFTGDPRALRIWPNHPSQGGVV